MDNELAELQKLDAELAEIERAQARDSFAVYCGLQLPAQVENDDEELTDERVVELEALAKKEQAQRYIPAKHHQLWCETLQDLERGYKLAERDIDFGDGLKFKRGEKIPFKRLMMFAPPGSAKSTYASVLFPSWYMGKHPMHNLIQGSYNDSLASRFGKRARNTYSGEVHREVFGLGLAKDSRAGGEWSTEKGGEYFSFGVNTGVTGRRAHGIILDDLMKGRKEANSETVRETTWETYKADVRTRMFPTTWIIYIATRWHEDDPAGRILPKNWNGESGWVKAKDGELWYVLSYVAIVEDKDDERKDPLKRKVGEHLWPEWFPLRHFAQEKITQGPYNWASLYKQRPQPLEGGIYKRKYFRLWPADQPLPVFSFIIQSYDTAFTEKTVNDPSACTVWGVFTHRRLQHIMLLECWKDWLAYPDLRRRVKLDRKAEYGDDMGGRHPERLRKPDLILIEEKGSGISLLQDLGAVGVAAWPYNPNKIDKVSRLVSATPFGAAGMIWLLESRIQRGEPVEAQVEFRRDVLQAGPASEEWDYADSFSQTVLYLRNNGMLEAKIATGDEDQETRDYVAEKRRPNPYAQ